MVTHALAFGTNDAARPRFAHSVAGLEMSHSLPLGRRGQNSLAGRSFTAGLSSIVSANSRLSLPISPRAPSMVGPRRLPIRQTSTSNCRSSLPTRCVARQASCLRPRLGHLRYADHSLFDKPRFLHLFCLLWAGLWSNLKENRGASLRRHALRYRHQAPVRLLLHQVLLVLARRADRDAHDPHGRYRLRFEIVQPTSRATVASSDSCHLGAMWPKVSANFALSSRELAGRCALVG